MYKHHSTISLLLPSNSSILFLHLSYLRLSFTSYYHSPQHESYEYEAMKIASLLWLPPQWLSIDQWDRSAKTDCFLDCQIQSEKTTDRGFSGSIEGISLKPPHSTIILRGLRGSFNWALGSVQIKDMQTLHSILIQFLWMTGSVFFPAQATGGRKDSHLTVALFEPNYLKQFSNHDLFTHLFKSVYLCNIYLR